MKAWAFIILNLMLMFSNDNILKRRQNKYNLICFIKKEEKNAFLHKMFLTPTLSDTDQFEPFSTCISHLIQYTTAPPSEKQNDSFVLLF